ncbi:MAG: trigger factor, partial [Planctomycetaceae bacterium]
AQPEMTPALLEDLGDFQSVEEFRGFVRESLQRQGEYRQQQAVRSAVVDLLARNAAFELPTDLVRRQTARELQRKVLELRRNGFPDDEIRRFVNVSRQNAQASTEMALREHFILEQIAEELKIEAEAADYDQELELIARQSDEPVRRVRARLEKSGQMDAIRNQIVERKVIEAVVAEAKVTDKPVERDRAGDSEFAIYHSVLGTKETDSIPQAMHDDAPGTDSKTETPR